METLLLPKGLYERSSAEFFYTLHFQVKENQFFASVSKMLLNQRARIEIGIHLMKRRFSLISDSLESITRVNRQLCRFHQVSSLPLFRLWHFLAFKDVLLSRL